MEYIYPNLPNYTKITSRAATSNAIVSSGAVLLFSEDGNTLTAKHPDGTYTVISGGSGGVDPSSTTATPDKVLSGYQFLTSAGAYASGTIPTVAPVSSGSTVEIASGYLASPVSIVVSGGVDVSDTTATAADVLSGAVFHDSTGAVTTGGILVYPASTFTPGTSAQYLPAGVYLGGSQTIAGDPALVASNILSGVSIFGVSGTLTPGSSGGGDAYFRCASVTSGGSTWTGNRAVLSGGSYSYESAVTSGLSFGEVTPEVGRTYTDGALVRAKLFQGIPASPVFYAPLNASSGTAATGQTLNTSGAVTYGEVYGIPAATFTGSQQITFDPAGLPAGNSDRTISLWALTRNGNSYDTQMFFSYGTTSGVAGVDFFKYENQLRIGTDTFDFEDWPNVSMFYAWRHVALVLDSGTATVYVDGTAILTDNVSWDTVLAYASIGSRNGSYKFDGSLAALRLYDRALTDTEIHQLYSEFEP